MPLFTPLPQFPLAAALGGTGGTGGSWTAYTPTVTAGSGTFTSASATGAYLEIGKLVLFRQTITLTTVGTGATNVRATLPSAAVSSVTIPCNGGYLNTGALLQSQVFGSATTSRLYDGSFPFTDGTILNVAGLYEKA